MSAIQTTTVESSDNITADTIIQKIEALNVKVNEATAKAKSNLEKLQQLLKNSGLDAKKQKEQITSLEAKITELGESNASLQEKAEDLKKINEQIKTLENNINQLLTNNEQITDALNGSSVATGGFQYNKKHSKHKRPFRLFSRSNSKTTSKKSKKRRRRPGKSVKKGGMKTRRRRRNKKSKKSKKRRK